MLVLKNENWKKNILKSLKKWKKMFRRIKEYFGKNIKTLIRTEEYTRRNEKTTT